MGHINVVKSEKYLREYAGTHGFDVVENPRVGWNLKRTDDGKEFGPFIVEKRKR